jgi:hypothetical protein
MSPCTLYRQWASFDDGGDQKTASLPEAKLGIYAGDPEKRRSCLYCLDVSLMHLSIYQRIRRSSIAQVSLRLFIIYIEALPRRNRVGISHSCVHVLLQSFFRRASHSIHPHGVSPVARSSSVVDECLVRQDGIESECLERLPEVSVGRLGFAKTAKTFSWRALGDRLRIR